MAFRSHIENIFGPISNNNPFVMLLIYAPTIAGLTLTIIFEGWSGFVALFKRGVFFTKPNWLLIAIFIIPCSAGLWTFYLSDRNWSQAHLTGLRISALSITHI